MEGLTTLSAATGCGVASRKAGDPGLVERITSFLGDNGYTRAWNDAVTAGLRPIDRTVADDEDRLSGVARGLAPAFRQAVESSPGEYEPLIDSQGSAVSDFGRGLNRIDPGGQLLAAYDKPVRPPTEDDQYPPLMYHAVYGASRNLADRGEGELDELLAASVLQGAQKYGHDPEAVRKLVAEGAVPESYLMNRGVAAVRHVLGNPYAAYGLPAAGVGLAAWGIHDVMAAQQQAEKESQLPLQGGVR